MANFFTMTNHDLHGQVGIWSFVFSLGVGLLTGYLVANECSTDSVYQTGINAGISLTVIGGVLGLCSCTWLGRRLKVAEKTTTRTVARNTTLTQIITTQNQRTTEPNPLGQETRNPGTEVNINHEAIELNPLGQEERNPGAEATDIGQSQTQQIAELQRRLTQLENQINQQQEARIEVITS